MEITMNEIGTIEAKRGYSIKLSKEFTEGFSTET